MDINSLSILIYETTLLPVVFFSVICYMAAIFDLFSKKEYKTYQKPPYWPSVTIQIPVFNDPVAIRCAKSCLSFDYPKNKFEIIFADDSRDVTKKVIDNFVKKHPNKVRVFRRNTREGFKSGALNNVLKHSKGDIIVIFDSDFVPSRKFLKGIVKPFFEDDKIAIVQSRMGYINHNQNFITKLASTFLMIYHNFYCPMSGKMGITFFCGTHGAIRKDVLLEAGGWNERNITEDAELSIKIFKKGYKSVYLPNLKVKGELPFTFEAFVRQQMRWTYGMTRTFIDNAKSIWFGNRFSLSQKALMTYLTFGGLIFPFVVVMTIAGLLGMITGTPHPITLEELLNTFKNFAITSGFFIISFIALKRENKLSLYKSSFFSTLTVGIVLSIFNAVALLRAIFNRPMIWYRTPKFGSIRIMELFKKYFKL
jgi:cellulose synthase/poly-beta-1,6-N-acetylglucosamine synthase-like glycosyltransferase